MWRLQHQHCSLSILLAALPLAFAIPRGPAGGEAQFSFRIAPDKSEKRYQSILFLRPNLTHAIEIYLKNQDKKELKNATVRLFVDGRDEPLATATGINQQPGEETKVVFAKGKDKTKAEPLAGPVRRWELELEANNKKWPREQLFVKVLHPRKYIKEPISNYDPDQRRLSFKVAMDEDIPGEPKCIVQLVVDPLFTPGLKDKKKGARQQDLTKPGQYLELSAEDLEFDRDKDALKDARIFLTVDGFERAFEFFCSFSDSGKLRDASYTTDVAVRFLTPRFALPTPEFPVALLVDGEIDQEMRLEIALDRSGRKDPLQFQEQVRPGLRDIRMFLEPSDKGDLICKTEVRDWKVPFNTDKVSGTIWLRAGVLKGAQGNTPVDVSEDALLPLAALRIDRFKMWSPLDFEKNRVYAAVTLDATEPEDVRFVDLDKVSQADPNKPLKLKAACGKRDEASQAPIDKAVFFYGKVNDGKTETHDGQRVPNKDDDPKTGELWSATLPAPGKPGPQEVSVQFITRTGKQVTQTQRVVFQPPPPKLATIKGIAFHVNESRPLAKLDVYLVDEKLYKMNDKSAQKDKVKTDADGKFEFKDVKPGRYMVVARQTTPALVGRSEVVEVQEGKELKEIVKLKLLAE